MDHSKREVFDKSNPTAGEKFFVPLPSDALHYIHHDRMSADKLFLYQLIIDYYNPIDGHAFPSIDTLSMDYGKSPDTTSNHIDDLKAVGLIDFPEKGYYVPLVPLPADAFYKEFPDAWTNYRTKYDRYETRRFNARERMRAWRNEKGYT